MAEPADEGWWSTALISLGNVLGLFLLVRLLQLEVVFEPVDGQASQVFFMASACFICKLMAISGITFSFGLLHWSKSARRGRAANAICMAFQISTAWLRVVTAASASYLAMGWGLSPSIVAGDQRIPVARIIEWSFTVPQIWFVYSRVYTNASQKQVNTASMFLALMLSTGFCSRLSSVDSAWYWVWYGCSTSFFAVQAWLIWTFPKHEQEEVQSRGRVIFLISQGLMSLYAFVWLAVDFGYCTMYAEHVYFLTILDVATKLALVWGCLVVRFVQAFPQLHVTIDGSHQCLSASYDARLILDSQFQVVGIDGKQALVEHYLGKIYQKNFLHTLANDAERNKFLQVARDPDNSASESITPKISLLMASVLPEPIGFSDGVAGRREVCADCVLSSRSSGLRLVALHFAYEPTIQDQARHDSLHSPPVTEERLGPTSSIAINEESAEEQLPASSPPSLIDDSSDSDGQRSCRWHYDKVGRHLSDVNEAVVLIDAMSEEQVMVGASRGFLELTRFDEDSVIGSPFSVLGKGIPKEMISKSTSKNFASFVRSCQYGYNIDMFSQQGFPGSQPETAGSSSSSFRSCKSRVSIGETQIVQPSRRADSSLFVNSSLCSSVVIKGRPYVLLVLSNVGEGPLVKLSADLLDQVKEQCRTTSRQVATLLQERSIRSIEKHSKRFTRKATGFPEPDDIPLLESSDEEEAAPEGLSFFSQRLDDHCVLRDNNITAERREPSELPTGCLVFSRQPIEHEFVKVPCLRFAVKIGDVTGQFKGLPLMGFTRRVPQDTSKCYPKQAQCMGCAVSIGRLGEAFARDKWEHTVIGFKKPPQSELQTWSNNDVPVHLRGHEFAVIPGNTLECIWTADGQLIMKQDGNIILSFWVKRTPDPNEQYFAFVDVCFSVSQVTLHKTTPWSGDDNADAASLPDLMDLHISHSVLRMLASKSIHQAAAECKFSVTVADPNQRDCPLIAVSDEFVKMSGFAASEILGKNCRFLNKNCVMSPEHLTALRRAQQTGERLTILLQNRKQDGQAFINLLDMRGFRVAQDLDSGDYLWYLVGVQADVTGLAASEQRAHHVEELQQVATAIRDALAGCLRQVALEQAGMLASGSRAASHSDASAGIGSGAGGRYRVLAEPEWLGDSGNGRAHVDLENWMDQRAPQVQSCDDTDAEALQQAPTPREASGVPLNRTDKADSVKLHASSGSSWQTWLLLAGTASAITLATWKRR